MLKNPQTPSTEYARSVYGFDLWYLWGSNWNDLFLFGCTIARQVWALSDVPMPRFGFSLDSVYRNFQHLVAVMENRQWTEHIRRSIRLYGKSGKTGIYWYEKARYLMLEVWLIKPGLMLRYGIRFIRHLLRQPVIDNTDVGGSRWVKPSVGTLLCNISGSCRKKGENFGVAWLLTTSVWFDLTKSLYANNNCFRSGAFECFLGCWKFKHQQVRVEDDPDCREVAGAIMQPQVWPLHRNLLSQRDSYLMAIEGWSVTVIEKEANRAATELGVSQTTQRNR